MRNATVHNRRLRKSPRKTILFLLARGHEKQADLSGAAAIDHPEAMGAALHEVFHTIPILGPLLSSTPGLIYEFYLNLKDITSNSADEHPSMLERFSYTGYLEHLNEETSTTTTSSQSESRLESSPEPITTTTSEPQQPKNNQQRAFRCTIL